MRAGYLCSDPACRRPTIGATSDGESEINLGVAAHICAASPEGPRYDEEMTRTERRSAANGIWMCQLHGKSIDSKDPKYTVDLLREWKHTAQREALRRVLYGHTNPPLPETRVSGGEDLLRSAVLADLTAHKRTDKWPQTNIDLKLSLEGQDKPLTTSQLATSLETLGDLIIIADPGRGKTSALYQIAEACLRQHGPLPLILSLPEWVIQSECLLVHITRRMAFEGIELNQLRQSIRNFPVVLLLDGWNELDNTGRERARLQLVQLQREHPELGFAIATRNQRASVPIDGLIAGVSPLDLEQQYAIAEALRGVSGHRFIDYATRQTEIRDLLSIPLYLNAILSVPDEAALPNTREALLRYFAQEHEQRPESAEIFERVLQDLPAPYLDMLAVDMTQRSTSMASEDRARSLINQTSIKLIDEGQIAITPEPREVLDILVSHHLLVRSDTPAAYSFQHQQFQEWYASHEISMVMLAAANNETKRRYLQAQYLDIRFWEEPILFACEQLSNGTPDERRACGKAILAALDVDPLLASKMVRRATDDVWSDIAVHFGDLLRRWHTPGRVDRAFTAMVTTGRVDFSPLTWPLLSHVDDQVHLHALRQCKPFPVSCLGQDAIEKISDLPAETRRNVLHELVMYGGLDSLDLVTNIAELETDVDVIVAVINALEFRAANNHLERLLNGASETIFDQIVKTGAPINLENSDIQAKIDAAENRQANDPKSTYEVMHRLISGPGDTDISDDVRTLIGGMSIKGNDDPCLHLIQQLNLRYPEAVARGLLSRLLDRRELFWGASDILAVSDLISEEDSLLEAALNLEDNRNFGEAAASILGPLSVASMLDKLDSIYSQLHAEIGPQDSTLSRRRLDLIRRIAEVPGTSLVEAIRVRAQNASLKTLSIYADLICRHPSDHEHRSRPFSDTDRVKIGDMFEAWSRRAMSDPEASSYDISEIAGLCRQARNDRHLPQLKVMLDYNIDRYATSIALAEDAHWRRGHYPEDAHHPQMHQYEWSLQAIDTDTSRALTASYLKNKHFGPCAARVLLKAWQTRNTLGEKRWIGHGIDFERVQEGRQNKQATPPVTCKEAELLFSAIKDLFDDASTDAERNLITQLAIIGVQLPHGNKEHLLNELIASAPHSVRAELIEGMILSGADIPTEVLITGVEEVLEEAKEQSWILTEGGGYRLKRWLKLIGFSSQPQNALKTILVLPERFRRPRQLDSMLQGLGSSLTPGAEVLLFNLAEADPSMYASREWRNAAFNTRTRLAAKRIITLAASGQLDSSVHTSRRLYEQIGTLFSIHPNLRLEVIDSLRSTPNIKGATTLLKALSSNPDVETFLFLVELEIETEERYASQLTLQYILTEQIPSETWQGALDIIPTEVPGLRAKLLAMVKDGSTSDPASSWLRAIDDIWDGTGWPETEPRHPDIASGKSWPM